MTTTSSSTHTEEAELAQSRAQTVQRSVSDSLSHAKGTSDKLSVLQHAHSLSDGSEVAQEILIPPKPSFITNEVAYNGSVSGTTNGSGSRLHATSPSVSYIEFGSSPSSPNFTIVAPPRSFSLAQADSRVQYVHDKKDRMGSITIAASTQSFTAAKSNLKPSSPVKDKFSSKLSHAAIRNQLPASLNSSGMTEGYKFPPSPVGATATAPHVGPIYQHESQTINTTYKFPHSPLGSATASKRSSLISSPPLESRSRSGSVAGGVNPTNRQAIYEYI